ncbi:hypothetical protein BD289DRAFT_485125 [Coniella lustricola]|uniref:Uncharacterized protein n=1 Tax=Coniella lustricola TaxID=2025994 RepID=A0A2T2ZZL8_9PEZI|nr:hypothetical protein BD289DRAFT_485125 [Coniella lustricola]
MDILITGSVFGAGLVTSGMYQPYLLSSQFALTEWNMAQTFFTATGCGALSLEILYRLGYAVPPPRSWSWTGITACAMDGNIIGGLILGAGMALSASCPGMVFPQLALGIPTAPAIVAGASVGGIFWAAVLRPCMESRRKRSAIAMTVKSKQPETTFADALGMRHTTALLCFEAVLTSLVMVAATTASTAPAPVHPVVGGLVIGGAQIVSLVVRGSLLGASTCYEQVGDWIVWMAKAGYRKQEQEKQPQQQQQQQQQRPGTSAILFAAAMVAGAWLLARLRPEVALFEGQQQAMLGAPSPATAFAGGLLMAVGSRMAGGCASGHGISGMALMSMSSLVTMASVFAAAMGVSKLTAIVDMSRGSYM